MNAEETSRVSEIPRCPSPASELCGAGLYPSWIGTYVYLPVAPWIVGGKAESWQWSAVTIAHGTSGLAAKIPSLVLSFFF